jgi:hypothetical protein
MEMSVHFAITVLAVFLDAKVQRVRRPEEVVKTHLIALPKRNRSSAVNRTYRSLSQNLRTRFFRQFCLVFAFVRRI